MDAKDKYLWIEHQRKIITDEVCEEMTSLFQGKRDNLKKQVTHWMGKHAIVKAENNRLRKKWADIQDIISWYEDQITSGSLVMANGKSAKEAKELVKCKLP